MIETMTIDEAIKIAKKEVKDQYCQAYLQAIPEAIDMGGVDGLDVQLLYAMSNMGAWRGESARAVKIVIKAYLKKKGRV